MDTQEKRIEIKRRVELKYGQFAIIRYSLEIYLSLLAEEYQAHPTLQGAKRQDEVRNVLDKFKNGGFRRKPL
jgi:hypothetical protein